MIKFYQDPNSEIITISQYNGDCEFEKLTVDAVKKLKYKQILIAAIGYNSSKSKAKYVMIQTKSWNKTRRIYIDLTLPDMLETFMSVFPPLTDIYKRITDKISPKTEEKWQLISMGKKNCLLVRKVIVSNFLWHATMFTKNSPELLNDRWCFAMGFTINNIIFGRVFWSKFVDYSNLGSKLLRLFNGRIWLEWQRNGTEIAYECRIYFDKKQWHYIRLWGDGDLIYWKNFFSIGFDIRKSFSRVKLRLLGIYNELYIGHIDNDHYNAHIDKWYDYYDYEERDGYAHTQFLVGYEDEEMTKRIPEPDDRPKTYKEFYISKSCKVYNSDFLNNPYGRTVEIALPWLHYFKIRFYKPFWNWDYLGFTFRIDFQRGFYGKIKFKFLKHTLSFVLGKNSLLRQSTVSSIKSIDRYYELKGNRLNKVDDLSMTEFSNRSSLECLKDDRRTPQLVHLITKIDEKYLVYYLKHISITDVLDDDNPIIRNLLLQKMEELDVPVETYHDVNERNKYLRDEIRERLLEIKRKRLKTIPHFEEKHGINWVMVEKSDTKLPCNIWLNEDGKVKSKKKQTPYILLQNNHADYICGNVLPITISRKPEITECAETIDLSVGDIQQIQRFIQKFYIGLMKHWTHQIATFSIIHDFGYYRNYEEKEYEALITRQDQNTKSSKDNNNE